MEIQAPAPGQPPVRRDSLSGERAGRRALTILHLTAPAPFGGLESVVRSLASGHQGRGHRVHVAAVLAAGEDEHPFLLALEERGVPVHPLRISSRGYRSERRQVEALCRALRPDVVHTHGYRTDVVDAGVALRLGIPLVTTVHGFTGGDRRNRLYEWLQRRSIRRFGAVVAVSRPLAAALGRGGVPTRKIHLVPNAWSASRTPTTRTDARRILGIPASGTYLGWVGRLSHEKGPDLLVDAMAALSDLPVDAVVIGDGPEAAALRARAAESGLSDRIRWAGRHDAAGDLCAAFDLMVLSSRTEGTPIVLLEAMAAGVPVVATRVGGIPDVVSGAEAVLVPPERADALASAIRSTLADPSAAARRVKAAGERLRTTFAEGPWLTEYEEIYHQLLSSSSAEKHR